PRSLSAVSEIAYSVRRSARARRVRVNVHPLASRQAAAVEVVLPERAPERAAAAAVSELRPWIERRLQDARRARARAQRSLAARAGSAYRGPSIRTQRTSWASCSPGGRMSFNSRLLLAPERVLDYVVWHEVCHLEVFDHSPAFWRLLERRWHSYRQEHDWLKLNGATLVL